MTSVRLRLDVNIKERRASSRLPLFDVRVSEDSRRDTVSKLMEEVDPIVFVVHPDRIELDVLFDFGAHIPENVWVIAQKLDDETGRQVILEYVKEALLDVALQASKEAYEKIVALANQKGIEEKQNE